MGLWRHWFFAARLFGLDDVMRLLSCQKIKKKEVLLDQSHLGCQNSTCGNRWVTQKNTGETKKQGRRKEGTLLQSIFCCLIESLKWLLNEPFPLLEAALPPSPISFWVHLAAFRAPPLLFRSQGFSSFSRKLVLSRLEIFLCYSGIGEKREKKRGFCPILPFPGFDKTCFFYSSDTVNTGRETQETETYFQRWKRRHKQ